MIISIIQKLQCELTVRKMKTSKIENSIISASAATKIQKLEQLVHL